MKTLFISVDAFIFDPLYKFNSGRFLKRTATMLRPVFERKLRVKNLKIKKMNESKWSMTLSYEWRGEVIKAKISKRGLVPGIKKKFLVEKPTTWEFLERLGEEHPDNNPVPRWNEKGHLDIGQISSMTHEILSIKVPKEKQKAGGK